MILKESTYCVPGFKKITLLYTIVPTGVGGHLFQVTLLCSIIGLRDTDFHEIYSFKDNLKFNFYPGPKFNPKMCF